MTVLPFRQAAPERMCPEELRSTIALLRARAMTGRGVMISRELAEQLADHLQATAEGV